MFENFTDIMIVYLNMLLKGNNITSGASKTLKVFQLNQIILAHSAIHQMKEKL